MLTPTGAARTDERAGWSGNTATGRRDENPMSRRPVLPGGTDLGAINWRADECHTRAIDTTAALHRNRQTDNLAANGRRGRTGRLVRKRRNRTAQTDERLNRSATGGAAEIAWAGQPSIRRNAGLEQNS